MTPKLEFFFSFLLMLFQFVALGFEACNALHLKVNTLFIYLFKKRRPFHTSSAAAASLFFNVA